MPDETTGSRFRGYRQENMTVEVEMVLTEVEKFLKEVEMVL